MIGQFVGLQLVASFGFHGRIVCADEGLREQAAEAVRRDLGKAKG
jgi:hypothetical protein